MSNFLPFEKAREFARSLGLSRMKEWHAFCKGNVPDLGNKPKNIPAYPNEAYKDKGWISVDDWLHTGDTATSLRQYKSFTKARKFARSLRLKSSTEWRKYCNGGLPEKGSKPEDIPVSPGYVYRDIGWVGFGDWLGTGTTATFLRKYRSYKSAREFVATLGLKNQKEWRAFCKGNYLEKEKKPDDIPASPHTTYVGKGWQNWGEWLGTGTTATFLKTYQPFNQAREYARNLGLQSLAEWKAYCKGGYTTKGTKPEDIPVCPDLTYKDDGWLGYGDWLGTGNIATFLKSYRSFIDAREFARSLNLNSCTEWFAYCKGEYPEKVIKPLDISSHPHSTYKGKGWQNWGDWLGTKRVSNSLRKYLPFNKAHEFANSLGLKNQGEWIAFCKGELPEKGKLPKDIPASPPKTYKGKGWQSWGHWLGTGNIATYLRNNQLSSDTDTLFKPPCEITRDANLLIKARGYWSGDEILFNHSNSVLIINKDLNTSNLQKVFKDYIEKETVALLESAIKRSIAENKSLTYYGFENVPSSQFNQKFYTSKNRSICLAKLSDTLISKGMTHNYIHDYYKDAWLNHYKNPVDGIIPLHKCPNNISVIYFNFLNNGNIDNVDKLINDLLILGTISTDIITNRFNDVVNYAGKYITNTCFNSLEPGNLINIANKIAYVAGLVILLLRKHEYLLLPRGIIFNNINSFKPIKYILNTDNSTITNNSSIGQTWQYELSCYNTIKSIKDLPVNFRELHGSFPSNITRFLSDSLRFYADNNNLPTWPIDRLKSNKKIIYHQYTPSWCKDFGMPEEWVLFIQTAFASSDSSENNKINSVRTLIQWAYIKNNINSPWDIVPHLLSNPFKPKDSSTLYMYLNSCSASSKADEWRDSAKVFKWVCASSKLKDSPYYGKSLSNPFENLENPFKTTKASKTFRPRIPQNILEAMIDTLLEPDENGEPTFTWARSVTTSDNAHFIDNLNDSDICLEWFPARCTCLAMLLLIPIRSIQGRWLDQGLLDKYIFNPNTGKMELNTHPLANFKYENGKNHLEQYGRPSGVIQMAYDEIIGSEEPLIYISTNKTQLWDPSRKTGYEIPWPDGKRLESSTIEELRDKGRRLGYVYNVLKFQIRWLERFDNSPIPLTFYHTSDRNHTNLNNDSLLKLPMFTPIFRDFNEPISYKYNGEIFQSFSPISKQKILGLFNSLAVETERRMRDAGYNVTLTQTSTQQNNPKCIFDVHSLRVAGISNLIEMGIPAHIVSEFVAGHMSLLMTLYYYKSTPAHIREHLYAAWEKNGTHLSTASSVFNLEHFNSTSIHSPVVLRDTLEIFDDRSSATRILGGICLAGGSGEGCSIGAIYTSEKSGFYGPVQGGCGNCRFFRTGPPFLLEQAYAANDVMIKMRVRGSERKELTNELNRLRVLQDDGSSIGNLHMIEKELAMVRSHIEGIESTLETLMSDWYNRFIMFVESEKLLKNGLEEKAQLTLLAVEGRDAFVSAPQRSEASEFELLRTHVEHARVLKVSGVVLPDDAGRMLREAMDIILNSLGSSKLLLSVPDKKLATTSASILANLLSDMIGDTDIQESLDKRTPLQLDIDLKSRFLQLTSVIIGSAERGEKLSLDSDSTWSNFDRFADNINEAGLL